MRDYLYELCESDCTNSNIKFFKRSSMARNSIFTSESVSEGHPDKMADQISDAILDAFIEKDPKARVACETLVKTGMVVVAGEISSSASIEIENICREVVCDIGYNSTQKGFDGNTCAIVNVIGKQSQDIALGVDESSEKIKVLAIKV